MTDIKEKEHQNLIDDRQPKSDANPLVQVYDTHGTNSKMVVKHKTSCYTWFQLIFIVVLSVCNQWQRFLIAYANGVGIDNKDEKQEIRTAYGKPFDEWFGFLAGPAFTISFAVMGIFGGALSDSMSRKIIISVACILWSACTFGSGAINSFAMLFILRFGLGLFESVFNPSAYSIIADLFPPEDRGTANSIFNMGIYFGGALSSISTLLILQFGWRVSFEGIGIIGVGFGIASLILVREPKRNAFDIKKKEIIQSAKPEDQALKKVQKPILVRFKDATIEIFRNPTCRWTVIAGMFRFFGGYAIGFFMPSYFGNVYKDDKKKYAVANAFIVSFCGFVSSLCGGLISDKQEKAGNYYAKAQVCIAAAVLGLPCIALCCLIQSNFWFSISMLGLEYLVAECWFGPAITMVLNTISPENKGFAVGGFLFCATIAGTIATVLAQYFTNLYDAENNVEVYGQILCVFVFISYAGCIPFFILAGREYKKFMVLKKLDAESNDF